MENELNNLSPAFVAFVKTIASQDDLDVYILRKLAQGNLPAGWQIVTPSHRRSKSAPMREAVSYIDCPDATALDSLREFQVLAEEIVYQGTYTAQGLGNLLLLVKSIGFMHDQEAYDTIEKLAMAADMQRYLAMTIALIRSFNNEFHFSEQRGESTTFEYYERIYLKLQYVEHYENPIHIIGWLISWRTSELPVLDLFSYLESDPRLAIMVFKPKVQVSAEEMIAFLSSHPGEIAFWAFVITDIVSERPTYGDIELLRFLVQYDWKEIGGHLLRKTFNNLAPTRMEESVKRDLRTAFNEFLYPQFFVAGSHNQVLSHFIIPTGLLALGGWLVNLSENGVIEGMNASSIEQFVRIYVVHLKRIRESMASYISGKSDVYHSWFRDVYDRKAQYSTHFMMIAILKCQDGEWLELLDAFTNLLYDLKVNFYGSYSALVNARQLSSHLLCVLLSNPSIDGEMKEHLRRLELLWERFTKLLGFSWIYYVEREKIIIDIENYKFKPKDIELSFILQRIRESPEEHKRFVGIFVNAINEYGTVPWPVS